MKTKKHEIPANDNKFTPQLWKVFNALSDIFPYVGVIPPIINNDKTKHN